jgi:hypothetical protein
MACGQQFQTLPKDLVSFLMASLWILGFLTSSLCQAICLVNLTLCADRLVWILQDLPASPVLA